MQCAKVGKRKCVDEIYVYLRMLMKLEAGRYVIVASPSSRHIRRLANDLATGSRKCSETAKAKKTLVTSPNTNPQVYQPIDTKLTWVDQWARAGVPNLWLMSHLGSFWIFGWLILIFANFTRFLAQISFILLMHVQCMYRYTSSVYWVPALYV